NSLIFIIILFSATYIKPCKRDEPDLKACVKQHAIAAIPYLLKGDKEYKIPSMVPLHIPLISLSPSDNLSIKMNNIVLRGLETAEVRDIDFDLKKKHVHAKLAFKKIDLAGEYEMNGRILVVPIQGKGPASIVSENFLVDYSFDYNLVKKGDGKEYIDNDIRPVTTYVAEKNHYQFDNLFNGDKLLGDRINEFLNEHQVELHEDLKGSLSEVINSIVTTIVKSMLSTVPFDEVFV
ncbi:hypothetical protein NQ318_009804, partial [Aromia moschata]